MSVVLLALALAASSPAVTAKPPASQTGPRVEVAFVLDTTGSMSGLIDGAKRKIWSIANQLASGQPRPVVRIALVAYRDRGDAYVTQVHDLTEDIDAVYAQLSQLAADGRGGIAARLPREVRRQAELGPRRPARRDRVGRQGARRCSPGGPPAVAPGARARGAQREGEAEARGAAAAPAQDRRALRGAGCVRREGERATGRVGHRKGWIRHGGA